MTYPENEYETLEGAPPSNMLIDSEVPIRRSENGEINRTTNFRLKVILNLILNLSLSLIYTFTKMFLRMIKGASAGAIEYLMP